MQYTSANAFRTALEERIKRTADPGGISIVRLRKMVVFDRLMARLLVVAPGRWIVKGGVALDLRLGDRARATRDLDLARQDNEEVATDDLLAAADTDLADFFVFTIEQTEGLDIDDDNVAARYHIRADLAGRRFEDVTLDIGFGDPLPSTPDVLRGSDILAFAELAPIEIPALPLEQQLAGKGHDRHGADPFRGRISGGTSTRRIGRHLSRSRDARSPACAPGPASGMGNAVPEPCIASWARSRRRGRPQSGRRFPGSNSCQRYQR
jgi:hypothetical protein